MQKNVDLNSLLDMVKALSEKQRNSLADQIMKMMSEPSVMKGIGKELIEASNPGKPDCPHCAAQASLGHIVKRGVRNGNQRYFCKSCGRHFFSTTNTAFAFTRKDADTWRRFISMTISGKSLHECAEECNIAYQTAFTWRHKVLNVFAVNQDKITMSGNVEVDEMLIPVSYKGNHIQGAFGKREKTPDVVNNLPRKAYKRGTDNKSRSSKDKACVFCMVENGNKNFFAAVPGVGFMSDAMLDATVAKHINKEQAMLLADDYNVTRAYLEKNGYKHMILLSNTSDNPKNHKPEIRDVFHLQHVNSMHRHIRNFLKPYYGVSTKYLSNYIALFVWLKSVGQMKSRKKADQISIARAASPDCYVTCKQLRSRPAVPRCA